MVPNKSNRTPTGSSAPGALRWKGMLANGGTAMRRAVTAVLAVACVAFAFTQLGFIGVQVADGSSAYLVTMLVPIALAATLLGTKAGALMGLFAGTVLFLHSVFLPLDYYELMYVTPVTSVVMLGVCGLLIGILLSLIMRAPFSRVARAVLVVVACLAVSTLFSAGFALSTIVMMMADLVAESGIAFDSSQISTLLTQARASALALGDATFQTIGDAVVMAVACLLGIFCANRGLQLAQEANLRTVYGAWLSAVVWIAFLGVAVIAYGVITASTLVDARDDLNKEVVYLLGQVERTAEYNGRVADYVISSGGGGDEVVDMTEGGLLSDLLAGYTEDGDGLVMVSIGDLLIGSDAERFGESEYLSDCFDPDTVAAIGLSTHEGTLERVIYDGSSAENDLIDLRLPGSSQDFSQVFTRQIGYLYAAEHDDYRVVMIRPATMVFTGRNAVMGWVTLSSVILLLAMFVLAWRLLDLLVARRVDAINSSLTLISDGQLDTRVDSEGTREFKELSSGINSTVDALQGWIAEAETRMDAELATAKAIQESALPRVFPPFPDILRFDVYATMNAAKEVGGDFYDFFLIGDECTPDAGKLGFVLADVSGKGVPAALFMMKAKTQLRDYMASGMELGEAVENVNRQLCEGNDAGMFVTAWVGVLDYATGHIDFVNAGHNPPLLWQSIKSGAENAADDATGDAGSTPLAPSTPPAGTDGAFVPKWRWLPEKSGLPLGLFDGMPYEAHSIDCILGDQLLLYTDGVTEAMSAQGELYGEDQLLKLAEENYSLHPREIIELVRRDVARHAAGAEQSDDITMLVLEVGVPPEITATLTVPADVDELPNVNAFIHTELDRRLCPLRAQNQIDIAVEELFVNVAHYAYKDADESVPPVVRVSYTYSAEPPSIQIDIADDGVTYDPLAKPDASTVDAFDTVADVPIGGLGILMAKNSVDDMSYERVDGSNVVTIVKKW